MKIKDICTFVTDGSHNPPQGIEKSEYMMLSSKNIFDDEITFDEPRFLSQKDFEREHKRTTDEREREVRQAAERREQVHLNRNKKGMWSAFY